MGNHLVTNTIGIKRIGGHGNAIGINIVVGGRTGIRPGATLLKAIRTGGNRN